MNKTIKNTKDVLKRMEEILNQAGIGEAGATAKPSLLEAFKAKTGLNKVRNER